MSASPRGYPFERIDYDAGQMAGLHRRLEQAAERVDVMQIVLRNVSDHLEGNGRALDVARSSADEVAAAFAPSAARIRTLKRIVLDYGNAAEVHGGRANSLMGDVDDAEAALGTAVTSLTLAQTELHSWERTDEYAFWRAGEETEASAGSLLARDARLREAVDAAEAAHERAASDLDDAWAEWERSFESWDDAYARAVASLGGLDAGYVPAADAATLAALADADTPEAVAAIWGDLDDARRRELATRYPDLIGNLEGVPYEWRIVANITALRAADGVEWGEPMDSTIDVLITEFTEHGAMPVSLNLFDSNQATAAMLYVEGFTYDSADPQDPLAGVTDLNVLMGGMMSEVNQMRNWGQSATDLNSATKDGTSATLVWFGYDTPNFATVGSSEQARAGAETLTNALRGLDLAAPASATTTVIAHSYASTTAFLAVGSADGNLGVDNLIAVGSAGLTDQPLGDDPDQEMDYSGTNIFATRAPNDWVAMLGRGLFSDHPIDPGSLPDATVFESDGGLLADGTYLDYTPGHGTHSEANLPIGSVVNDGGYLERGSESFANIANIISHGEPLETS